MEKITAGSDASRLLALLSRQGGPGPDSAGGSGEALTDKEWFRLVELARKHRVAAVLYQRLREREVPLPASVSELLRSCFRLGMVFNIQRFHERDRIFRAMEATGITVVPFKGSCLAEAVYGNIALRSMGDIDLWISPSQVDEACRVMRELGYESKSKADRPQALQDALTGETQFFRTNMPLVELHWTIFPGEWLRHTSVISEEILWQRTVPFQGEMVRQLAPEDAVVQLCIHLAVNHQMSEIGLRTMMDLEFARRAWSPDWAGIASRARAWRVSCATWLVLRLFAEVCGDPGKELPLRSLAPSRLRQRILHHFVSPPRMMDGIHLSSGPQRFLYLLLLVDRLRDALVLVGRTFFPDRTWLTLRYGLQGAARPRVFLQRLWHPLRILLYRKI